MTLSQRVPYRYEPSSALFLLARLFNLSTYGLRMLNSSMHAALRSRYMVDQLWTRLYYYSTSNSTLSEPVILSKETLHERRANGQDLPRSYAGPSCSCAAGERS